MRLKVTRDQGDVVMQDPEALEQENDEVIGLLAGKAAQLRAVRSRAT